MAADEYSTGGGKLKLKGSKVSGGRVEKKKKKAGKKKEESGPSIRADEKAREKGDQEERDRNQEQDLVREDTESGRQTPLNEREADGVGAAKTETERKYEEVRRKRLHERLQREGVKTHKERVEELNTYLSRLSEHHDMPKIGPG
ncbi:hypothetical protein N7492_007038 [Penicillium capsulatum]|uniref:DUF1754-domain-containing protein n=1 Tax=Penicillium capsulatum TaxID=69766 RepID=A0A9W9I1I9_9EURO|nr:hypothetical protein N7492_007038 [Penicillium capsulatum]KAJ6116872.1 hypothetical protein N7512_006597 [Penicillium capsulatum]